jgi:Asp-tRNA(Asn)/Glu-tRNA(Gln) amidotransferase A subunit family amidase
MKKTTSTIVLLSIILLVSVGFNLLNLWKSHRIETNIKSAEKLFKIDFTQAERDSLKDDVVDAIEKYKMIHSYDIPNNLAPALVFSPVPVHYNPNFASSESNFEIPKSVSIPENIEELAFFTVAELSHLIKTKQISSESLTKMYIERLKRYDSELHCVITLLEERAMDQARAMDAEIGMGKYRGPLHGIPFGVKDLLALEGYPFTYGSPIYKDQIAEITSPVIGKLQDAGAVLVAKLSLGELAWGDVWFAGKTRNPWNTDMGSSGSSAGSASATAAGLVPFAIGSETWGSIVSPSTVCGVTGLRPTFGRVSRTGAMALSWSMDKIGPLCRTAQDCAIVIDAIAGTDGIDPTLKDMPTNIDFKADVRNLRVGYAKSYFDEDYGFKTNDSIALQVIMAMGIELIPVELPEHLPMDALSIILDVEAAAAFSNLTLSNMDDMMVRQGKVAWPNFFRKARFIPAVEYLQANRIRTDLISELEKLFEKVDVIVTPSFGGNQLLMTNLSGHPALAVPTGFSSSNLPTSITLLGNWYREDQILLLGKAYQDKTQWYRETPDGFTP